MTASVSSSTAPFPTQARSVSSTELTVGDWAAFDVTLTAADVEAFAALTGDRSPIHMDADYAARAGLAHRIVHGMLAASFLSTMVGMFLPGRRAMLMAEKTDFVEPIAVGSTLTVTARVHQVSPAARAATLVVLVLQGGLVAVRSSVTLRIREDH